MSNFFKYTEDISNNLTFSKPEKVRNIYYSHINNNNKPLFIQTCRLEILTNMKNLDTKEPSIELKISSDNLEFYEFLNKIDNLFIQETFKNSKNWFNKEIPLDVIDDMYKRIIKPIEKNKLPTVRFKLPIVNSEIATKIYDQNKNNINIQDINTNVNCILMLHFRGIKFLKQQYVCDIYISQIKVFNIKCDKYIISDDCLIKDGNNEINDDDKEIIDEENYYKINTNELLNEKIILQEENLKIDDNINNLNIKKNNNLNRIEEINNLL